jgi:hypothetical protein
MPEDHKAKRFVKKLHKKTLPIGLYSVKIICLNITEKENLKKEICPLNCMNFFSSHSFERSNGRKCSDNG